MLLATLEHIAARFGIPLAPEKTEGPTTMISFLGIGLDSDTMECRLPEDKLAALKEEIIETWRLARSVERLNKARKKVNRDVSRFVVRNGGWLSDI